MVWEENTWKKGWIIKYVTRWPSKCAFWIWKVEKNVARFAPEKKSTKIFRIHQKWPVEMCISCRLLFVPFLDLNAKGSIQQYDYDTVNSKEGNRLAFRWVLLRQFGRKHRRIKSHVHTHAHITPYTLIICIRFRLTLFISTCVFEYVFDITVCAHTQMKTN